MPFPNICFVLAAKAHMYICVDVSDDTFGFVKCQTLPREDVCDDVISHVETELLSDGFQVIEIDEEDMCSLNNLVNLRVK